MNQPAPLHSPAPGSSPEPACRPDGLAALAQGLSPHAPALSLAIAVLVGRHLRFDAADPHWRDRDRLVVDPALPGCNASLATALAGLLGAGQVSEAAGGVAVGAGVGLALGERLLAARFGRSLVDHRAWVLCPGADLARGNVQEAACLAGLWRLGRLTVIADVQDGCTAGLAGFAAHGWTVRRAAAGDAPEMEAAFSAAMRSVKPTLIAVSPDAGETRTVAAAAPDAAAWREAGQRHAGLRRAWLKRLARHAGRADLDRAMAACLPAGWPLPPAEPAAASTAGAIRQALRDLAVGLPELAQLPGEPGWAPAMAGQPELAAAGRAAADRIAGRLTMGLGGALFGLATHGGLLPVCALPSASLDAALPGLRAAAAAAARLLQIVIEPAGPPLPAWRANLRALPNLLVMRPGDGAEALQCLELAVRRTAGPSVLLLSDAALEPLAGGAGRARAARGGYRLSEAPGPLAATLIASGPELGLAMRVQAILARAGVCVAVTALPCWELFEQQDAAWRAQLLGAAPRIGIEPGSGFGWERWLGDGGLFICPDDTGLTQAHLIAAAVQRHIA